MPTDSNHQILLASRPRGYPSINDFAVNTVPIPEPTEGEVLIQSLWLSLDPYPRVPGANPEWADSGEPDENERRRPFEGLADLLKKQN